jgi:hypothetical protein
MDDDRDQKFFALMASGIGALLIVLVVAAQHQLGRTPRSITDISAPATTVMWAREVQRRDHFSSR